MFKASQKENCRKISFFSITRFLIIVTIVLLFTTVISSCNQEPSQESNQEPTHKHTWGTGITVREGVTTYECQECHAIKTEYAIGSKGPARGIVFYDCDADNSSGNTDGLISSECGWRYLEAAPYDLFLIDGWKPSVDAEDPGYVEGEEQFYFGYVSNFNVSQKTGTAIGTGKVNTEECWNCLKEADVKFSDPFYASNNNEDLSAFGSHFGESVDIGKTYPMFPLQLYAVKLCKMLYNNGYADWFLPSKDEMQYLYDYLDSTNTPYLARNGFYWTSSVAASDSIYVVGGVKRINNLFNLGRIRPIRAFSDSVDGCIHEFVETITPPTCTQCGLCERTCKNCGYSYEFRNAKPLGHDYEIQIGQITRCKTCNEIIYGPAGGFIFYDCDADNETGNADGLISTECGWRYLEVTPEPYICKYEGYAYGANRTSPNGKNIYSNGSIFYSEGTSDPNDGKCTGTAIGTGKANTIKLINSMGESAYCKAGVDGSNGENTTTMYIAKIYDSYELNGFDDWFLPSRDEMIKLYEHILKTNDTTLGFSHNSFWTSSEDGNNHDNALYIASGARVFSESRENYVTWCVLIPIRQVEAD